MDVSKHDACGQVIRKPRGSQVGRDGGRVRSRDPILMHGNASAFGEWIRV